MAKIRILPPELADMLRAGEVVERPASALKELIENSLDAGARHIGIEIKQGGKKLIMVADDGEGMEGEDALLALERHATSKLSSPEGLNDIRTLGFRGEALPSIASVSKLTLITAPKGKGEGIEIECHGGKVVSRRPAPARGTIIQIKDLFFNTPARRKFLKADSTEGLHIIGVLTSHALSHPETGFTLNIEGKETVDLPPARDERERIAGLYGAEFLEGLKEINHPLTGIKIRGFISGEGNLRSTKGHQYIFIGRRPVRDQAVSHALYSALAVPSGRHPIFFLYLEVDPALYDVNAHPRKEEVRWREKDLIYRAVYGATRGISPGPAPSITEEKSPGPVLSNPGGPYRVVEDVRQLITSNIGPDMSRNPSYMVSEGLPMEYKREGGVVLKLGEMFYALSEGEGITIIDHHAAHERVLYERFLNGFALRAKALLFPRQIKLPPRQYWCLLENSEILKELGIEVEDFGGETIILRSLPEELMGGDLQGILLDVAQGITERGGMEELKKEIAARLACHNSVRGKEALSGEELFRLIKELDACRDPGRCPHGRPTRINLSIEELKKMFKRK